MPEEETTIHEEERFCSQEGRATYAQISWLRQVPSSSSGSPHSVCLSDGTGEERRVWESEDRGAGGEAMMVEVALESRQSVPLYLFESSRTSGQGTLVKCCPPRVPFPGVSLPGDSGD